MFGSAISFPHRTGFGGAAEARTVALDASPFRGISDTNATAQTRPGRAYSARIHCQESGPRSAPVRAGAMAAPIAMQHASIPEANARSDGGNSPPIILVAHGKIPDWAHPIRP